MNTKEVITQQDENQYLTPLADIFEGVDSFTVIMEMPGVTKDSLSLTVEGKRLSIKGTVKPYHDQNATLLVKEVEEKNYYRVFNLMDGIDTKKIEAELENGVLTIMLLKHEDSKPKEIQVK